jgi:peptidoglycan/LPS O-acetylase OafA/YrhL
MNYYPRFDWLRGALAVVVMLQHAGLVPWHNSGPFAVHVFFVLSGWLIGGILLDLQPKQLPRFFYNRTLRIWVPYFIGLALLLGVGLLRDAITPKWLEIATYKATMVYNVFGTRQLAAHANEMPLHGSGSHFWSVNAEEQFYLITPLLLVLLRWRGLGRSPWLWVAICAWMIATGTEYGGLSMGVLARIVLRDNETQLTRAGRALSVLLLAASIPFVANDATYIRSAPVAGLMIVLLLSSRGASTPLASIAGGMSYSLYLNHWIGIYVASFIGKKWGLTGAVPWSLAALVLPVAMAVAHYQLIDRTIHESRGGWYTPARGRIATVVAYSLMAMGLIYGWMMWR